MSVGSCIQVNHVSTWGSGKTSTPNVVKRCGVRSVRGIGGVSHGRAVGGDAVLLPWMPTAPVDPFPPHLFTPFGLDVVDL